MQLELLPSNDCDYYNAFLKQNYSLNVTYSDWICDIKVNAFLTNTTTTLTTFFFTNTLDIPKTFKRIRSLMQPTSSTLLTQLSAILMKHGRKAYISRALTKSLIWLTHSKAFDLLNKYSVSKLEQRYKNASLPNYEIINLNNTKLEKKSWLSKEVFKKLILIYKKKIKFYFF